MQRATTTHNLPQETIQLINKIHRGITILKHAQSTFVEDKLFIDSQISNLKEWVDLLSRNTDTEEIDKFLNAKLNEIEYYKDKRPAITPLLNKIETLFSDNYSEITSPKFVVPPKQVYRKDLEWVDLGDKYKIGFRGDSRHPKKEIFTKGLIPRGEAYVDGFDLEPLISEPWESLFMLTAFTSRFLTACCFPLGLDKDNDTWVYIFKISKFVDVHNHGVKAFLENSPKGDISVINIPNDDLNRIFVDELVTTNTIPPTDIIGAIRVNRFPYDPLKHSLPAYLTKPSSEYNAGDEALIEFFKKRGRFELGQFVINPKCNLPKNELQLIKVFIRNEMKANIQTEQGTHLPLPPSGYQQNSFLQELRQRAKKISTENAENQSRTMNFGL